MKLRKPEWAALIVTLVFSCIAVGYLLGRSQPAGVSGGRLSVTTESDGATAGAGDTARGMAEVAPSPATPSDQVTLRININTATRAELTDLPGIGEQLASRIVEYREQNGAFAAPEDIMNVNGIGEKKFEAIRDYITTE